MKGPPSHWTTLKKLIYLKAARGSGPSWVWQLLMGTAPLTLLNAVSHPLKSLTQYGLCVQDGTPTPDDPVPILCNNGEIKYGALGANLFDTNPACIKLNFYLQASDGTQQPSTTNFIYVPRIPVEPGKSYVFYGRKKSGNTMSQYNRIAFFEADGTYLSTASYPKGSIGRGTAPENAAYCVLSCNPSGESAATGTPISQEIIDSYNWTFVEGTAEIVPFEPFVGGIYTDGTPEVLTVSADGQADQTATVQNLFAVGDYKDEQEIISGVLTHKVGIIVLDGTENWTVGTVTGVYQLPVGTIDGITYKDTACLCTHFNGLEPKTSAANMTDLSCKCGYNNVSNKTKLYIRYNDMADAGALKAYLAAQYAAGTPVIIVYPLATPTTEQTTPHALHTTAGTNVVDVTSNVDPVTVSVEYAKQSA